MTFFEVFCGNIVSVGIAAIFFVGAVIRLFGEIPYKIGSITVRFSVR